MQNDRVGPLFLAVALGACGPAPELEESPEEIQFTGTPGGGPVVSSVSAVRVGTGPVTVNYFVKNEGTTTSAPFTLVAYYRETFDCVLSTGVIRARTCQQRTYSLGAQSVPAIARGEWAPTGMSLYFNDFVGRFTAPLGALISSGTITFDPRKQSEPSRRVHLARPGEAPFLPMCSVEGTCPVIVPLADLAPVSAHASFNSANRSVGFSFQVRNAGSAAASRTTPLGHLFLSRDTTLDRSDILLEDGVQEFVSCGLNIAPLAAGASSSASFPSCKVPYYAEGTYYVLSPIDGDSFGSKIPESNELNNLLVSNPIVLPTLPRQNVTITLDDYRLTTGVGPWLVSDHVGAPPLGTAFEIGPSATAWWQFDPILVGPPGARYRVEIRWAPAANRPSAVVHQVIKADGTLTNVTLNQTVAAGTWVSLGTYSFAANTGNHVRIRAANQLGKVTGVNAVRLVLVP